jgi:hypothetical protein
MTGTDTRGFQVSRIKALGNIAPLTARQITELLKSGDTIEALELSLLQGMGEGVDTFDYDEAQKEQKALKEERGLGTKKKKKSSGGSYSYPF